MVEGDTQREFQELLDKRVEEEKKDRKLLQGNERLLRKRAYKLARWIIDSGVSISADIKTVLGLNPYFMIHEIEEDSVFLDITPQDRKIGLTFTRMGGEDKNRNWHNFLDVYGTSRKHGEMGDKRLDGRIFFCDSIEVHQDGTIVFSGVPTDTSLRGPSMGRRHMIIKPDGEFSGVDESNFDDMSAYGFKPQKLV